MKLKDMNGHTVELMLVAIFFLFVSLLCVLAKAITLHNELSDAKATIEILEETQQRWCPYEVQGAVLTYSIWKEHHRGGYLTCFYGKASQV